MAVITKIKLIPGLLLGTVCLYLYSYPANNDHISTPTEDISRQHRRNTGNVSNRTATQSNQPALSKPLPVNSTLLQEIRDKIKPPSKEVEFHKNAKHLHESQASQSQYIDKVNGQLRSGFFVECGAASGLELSNTIFFERERNWTGLLVEANPSFYEEILKNKRRSHSLNACMSLSVEPTDVMFKNAGVLGGIVGTMDDYHLKQIRKKVATSMAIEHIPMRCYPLHNMLQALGEMHVNYFSLDVEGPELDILKTIPFDHIIIDFLTVEYRVVGSAEDTLKKLRDIRDYMIGTGLYEQIALLNDARGQIYEGISMEEHEVGGLDVVFKRKDVVKHD